MKNSSSTFQSSPQEARKRPWRPCWVLLRAGAPECGREEGAEKRSRGCLEDDRSCQPCMSLLAPVQPTFPHVPNRWAIHISSLSGGKGMKPRVLGPLGTELSHPCFCPFLCSHLRGCTLSEGPAFSAELLADSSGLGLVDSQLCLS